MDRRTLEALRRSRELEQEMRYEKPPSAWDEFMRFVLIISLIAAAAMAWVGFVDSIA